MPAACVALHPDHRVSARLVEVAVDQIEPIGALVQSRLEVGGTIQYRGVLAQAAGVTGAPLDVEDAVGREPADGRVYAAIGAVEGLHVQVEPVGEDGVV